MKIRFTHLELSNWRNFRRVDLSIQDRLFLVGPNASGKSNLLDAFRFLRDLAQPKGGLANALDARGGMPHLRSLHVTGTKSDVELKVSLEIDGTPWEYDLALGGTGKKPFAIKRERVLRADQELLSRPDKDDERDPRQLEQTHLEQLSQNAKFRQLAQALASTEFVHVVPQLARAPELRGSDSALRDSPGSDFIEELAGLPEKTQKGRLNRLGRLLKAAVPQFEELRITREPRTGLPHLEARYAHWRARGGWQNEREFSDGTLRLIGLLHALLDGDAPLVLEEPELSLHEAVVAELPSLLHRAAQQRGRQVLVSTHAGSMLAADGLDPSEVALLIPTQAETEVFLASDDKEILAEVAAGLSLRDGVRASTRPANVGQLALPLEGRAGR
jgi:predicted ATPase